jgi:hypothetical protein
VQLVVAARGSLSADCDVKNDISQEQMSNRNRGFVLKEARGGFASEARARERAAAKLENMSAFEKYRKQMARADRAEKEKMFENIGASQRARQNVNRAANSARFKRLSAKAGVTKKSLSPAGRRSMNKLKTKLLRKASRISNILQSGHFIGYSASGNPINVKTRGLPPAAKKRSAQRLGEIKKRVELIDTVLKM